MNDSEIYEIFEITDEELDDLRYPDFLFSPLQNDFHDGFWESKLDEDESMKEYLRVLKQSKFKRMKKFFYALNLYDEYMEKLYSEHGGKKMCQSLINIGLVKPLFKRPKLNTKSKEVKEYLATGELPVNLNEYVETVAVENENIDFNDNREIIEPIFSEEKADRKAAKQFMKKEILQRRKCGVMGHGAFSNFALRNTSNLTVTDRLRKFADAPATYSLENIYNDIRRYDNAGNLIDESVDLLPFIKEAKKKDKHTEGYKDPFNETQSEIVVDDNGVYRHRSLVEREMFLKLLINSGIHLNRKGLSKEEVKFVKKFEPSQVDTDLTVDEMLTGKKGKKAKKKLKKLKKREKLDRIRRLEADSALSHIMSSNTAYFSEALSNFTID